ncbi:MAG: 3-dehydroquinate synthase, partial [Nitrosospira sp.]|nr:3-dehydroquinate synthase [Nitrosospira sp.]
MQTITVGLTSASGERSYPIHIGSGILSQPELILNHLPRKRVAIVTNTTVAPLYME